ncbi:hypothetical protein B6D29_04625, partial [Microgenomates bacterium UTCPR1]
LLVNKIEGLNPKIDKSLQRIIAKKTIKKWIFFVNPFGYPNGGVRYMQKGGGMHAAPLGVSEFFMELIDNIKSECNKNKVIDAFI